MNASQQSTPNASPLAGQRVLITRAAHQSEAFAQKVTQCGAVPVYQPAIEIVGPEDWTKADRFINNLSEYSRMVFVSANTVTFFLERVAKLQQTDALKRLTPEIVAIGPSTQAAIESYGLIVTRVPENANSQSLAKLLVENSTEANTLVLRGDRGSSVLSDGLREAKIDFEELPVYRSQDVLQPDPNVFDQMAEGKIEWTTITSSAIANSTCNLFSDALRRCKIATISPTTTDAVQRLGYSVAAEASRYDLDGMIESMKCYEADRL